MRHLILLSIIIVTSCLCVSNTYAKNHALSKLNHSISTIKHGLAVDRHQRHSLQYELKKVELKSAKVSVNLKKIHKKLTKQRLIIAKLEATEQRYSEQIHAEKTLLATQIRQAYLLGHQPYLKLLFNQQDPNKLARILTYFDYLNRSRLQTIARLQKTYIQAQNTRQKIKSQVTVLQQLNQKQHHHQQQLATVQHSRIILIKHISHTINNKRLKLAQLLDNKRRLEHTLTLVEHNYDLSFAKNKKFTLLKRHLPWPTRGKILDHFGTQIGQSELRWMGILIKAQDGNAVRAIANGKVVFANWLPGYGLLLIINHGNGYMTLYGRNHTLYKEVGDRVQAGDLIATVGQSGGYQTPALYFAIRHNAKPLNPLRWLR